MSKKGRADIVVKKAIKYAILTVCGAILFFFVNRAANTERPAASIGGEAFFLILPLMWWIVERTVKDLIGEFKREWSEIKAERESGGEDSPEPEKGEKKINALYPIATGTKRYR